MAPEKIKRLDFVSVLHRLCQKFKFELPKYQFLKERGSHLKTFWVGITMDQFGISVSGEGKSRKKYSKQNAAHKMLLELMKVAKSGQCFERVSNKKLMACCKWIELYA